MASQVLSGASNPSYRNNTDQNVRIVINYMQGTAPIAASGNPNTGSFRAAVPSVITLNWAGVSASSALNAKTLVIGRNLAFSQIFRDTAMGGTQSVFTGVLRDDRGNLVITDRGLVNTFQAVGVNNSVSITAVGNNSNGEDVALPTELIIAPGQTFSAICGIHNIVIIPELG
jgi:hypothetical protein